VWRQVEQRLRAYPWQVWRMKRTLAALESHGFGKRRTVLLNLIGVLSEMW
jgi:hypothetical protein